MRLRVNLRLRPIEDQMEKAVQRRAIRDAKKQVQRNKTNRL